MERSKLLDLYNDRKDPSVARDVDLRSSGIAESSEGQEQPNLYRGWKNSEGALKKKKREVSELKDRVKMLQESHMEFRAQMKTLESVKELSLQLQSQNSALKKENTLLKTENKGLRDLNQQAEDVIKKRLIDEEKQSKMLQEMHQGLFVLRGRYEELDAQKRELETTVVDEIALRKSTESKIITMENEYDDFRNLHRELQSKHDVCNARLAQCTAQLSTASKEMAVIKREVDVVAETREKLATTNAAVHVLKGDLARMVRLLDQYPAAKNFMDQWGDSHGLSFVGTVSSDNGRQKTGKNELNMDGFATGYNNDKENNDNGNLRGESGLTSDDFEKLKNEYSGDPYPLTQSLEDEEMVWVPHEAHKLGVEFLTSKLPHTPTEVIMDFLRKMNKVWIRREKRKLERIRHEYDDILSEYRRKLAHSKPYKGVIAEKQIERLQTQVIKARKKYNTGRAKKSSDTLSDDINQNNNFDDFDHLDLKAIPPHHRRLCQLEAMKAAQKFGTDATLKRSSSPNTRGKASNITSVSTEKMLESSLMSLEKLGQRMANESNVRNHEMELIRHSISHEGELYPSESYLRGAIWLGRNCTALMEELSDSLETMKQRHLADLSNAVADPDAGRAVSRLHLSGTSMITDVVTTAVRYKIRCKDIIKEASRIIPGRKDMLEEFAVNLPIDSTIAPPPTSHSSSCSRK